MMFLRHIKEERRRHERWMTPPCERWPPKYRAVPAALHAARPH